MRTTVEISDAQRSKLLELAAERGEKGFSRLVQEAIDRYLLANEARAERVRDALEVLGTLPQEEADSLEQAVTQARRSWR